MHDVKTDAALSSAWSGGASPFAMGSKKLGMWLFIVSDTLTFSALLITYSYSRLTNPDWPRPFPINPAIIFSTTMTVVLLASSLTMVMAVMAAQRNDRKNDGPVDDRHDGRRPDVYGPALARMVSPDSKRAPRSPTTRGARRCSAPSFSAITGLHMTHVMIGVIYLGIVATGYGRGKFSAEDVEVNGLYWHFVDLVWMFVFPLIYLMSVKY